MRTSASRRLRETKLWTTSLCLAPETIQPKRVMPGPDARRARTQVITRLQRNGFDPPGVRRHRQEEIDVRSPSVALDDWLLAGRAHGIADHSHANQAEAAERIVDPWNLGKATSEPAANPLQLPYRLRHVIADCCLTDDDVSPALESLDQLGDLFRPIGQVTLHEDDGISTWVSAVAQRRAKQRVDRPGVAHVFRSAEDRDGKGIGIRREDFSRGVGTPVIEHDQLVFTREVRKRLADTPEYQTCGLGFVMDRDADV
jgi:hypothetical protein